MQINNLEEFQELFIENLRLELENYSQSELNNVGVSK